MTIEIHTRPKWPTEQPPTFAELSRRRCRNVFGIAGVLAPSAAHHAVLLAGHAWEHDPLGSIGALADVAAMLLEAGSAGDRGGRARAGASRACGRRRRAPRSTRSCSAPDPPPGRRSGSRHLHETRERTVFEGHVERLVGPVVGRFAAAAPVIAAARAWPARSGPRPDEAWSAKMRRSRRALRQRVAAPFRDDLMETE